MLNEFQSSCSCILKREEKNVGYVMFALGWIVHRFGSAKNSVVSDVNCSHMPKFMVD